MQNFNDILNGVSDGSKDLSINALTVAGTATLNGNIILGNNSADTITVTGTFGVFALAGVTDASSAATGKVGEVLSVTQSSATSFPSTGTFGDLGSISMTAGDWDVYYSINATSNGADALVQIGITTTSGNSTTGLAAETGNYGNVSLRNADGQATVTCFTRVNISSPTTYYAKVSSSYSGSAPTYKGIMRARRIR
jgi:hypothetical protein